MSPWAGCGDSLYGQSQGYLSQFRMAWGKKHIRDCHNHYATTSIPSGGRACVKRFAAGTYWNLVHASQVLKVDREGWGGGTGQGAE